MGADTDPDAIIRRKRELRSTLRARRWQRYGGDSGSRRREQEAGRLLEHAAPLVSRLEAQAARGGAPLVAAYHPTPTEADVMPLVGALAAAGAELIFPAAAGRELEWVRWDGLSGFVDSPGRGFGKEPTGARLGPDALAGAALVLLPAVAVDRSGTRIGHGAGYYDRALTAVRVGTPVVAVVHPDELLEAGTLPRAAHDVPVPAVLTADGLVWLVTNDAS
ncbi:5-formyltetrahydrofolate cyclo-ligase [Brachybacterium sp. GCM10030267]|uniref:5-formyltetrahydrofolate cyclo-ligase n=1 Tax=unclassified Brachybacterium TaxID=2623841 RepID=UPI00361E8F69